MPSLRRGSAEGAVPEAGRMRVIEPTRALPLDPCSTLASGAARTRAAPEREAPKQRGSLPTAGSTWGSSAVRALLVFLAAWLAGAAPAALAQEPRRVVYVASIDGVIDLGLAPFLQRILDEASRGACRRGRARDQYLRRAGRRCRADARRPARTPGPTVAFVNKRAISAGALIALAAEKIVMAGGGTIGAATPVQLGQPGEAAKPVEEKTVSYMRKEFRATAESRKRPPLLAEAMVDADVAIARRRREGQAADADDRGSARAQVVDFRADTLEAALERVGLGGAEVRRGTPNWAEKLVRFLTHPVVSSLLITIAHARHHAGAAHARVRHSRARSASPAWRSFSGATGWCSWPDGRSCCWCAGGVLLLVLEVFVIPGFGARRRRRHPGAPRGSGASLVGPGYQRAVHAGDSARVAPRSCSRWSAACVLLRFLPRLPFGRRLVLADRAGRRCGATYRRPSRRALARPDRHGRIAAATAPASPRSGANGVDVVSDGRADRGRPPSK